MKNNLVIFRKVILGACFGVTAAANAAPILWIDDSSGTLGKVDVATGLVTVVGSTGKILTDIAFDSNGNLFGITFGELYKINTATAAATLIGSLGTNLNSLVFNASGNLYGANTSLYSINTSTGAASLIGNGGTQYNSSGDLAFASGNLYLSSALPMQDSLFKINVGTGAGTLVGSMGVSSVYGLASDNNVNLYGVSGTSIYSVNTATGNSTFQVNYSGQGLGVANGTAFITESTPPVPEPETYALMLAGLSVVGFLARRRNTR